MVPLRRSDDLNETVKSVKMATTTTNTERRPASWQLLLAFGIIYFVWGSTFFAIRVGVHEVPPLLLAAIV